MFTAAKKENYFTYCVWDGNAFNPVVEYAFSLFQKEEMGGWEGVGGWLAKFTIHAITSTDPD